MSKILRITSLFRRFSPSTGFWYNATDGKKASEFKDVLGDGDLSSMKFDFVSLKGREIARDIDRSLLTLFMSHDENENPFESYDAKARDKRKNRKRNKAQIRKIYKTRICKRYKTAWSCSTPKSSSA